MFETHLEVPSISKRLSSDSIQGFRTISLLHRISYAYICLCKMPRPGGGADSDKYIAIGCGCGLTCTLLDNTPHVFIGLKCLVIMHGRALANSNTTASVPPLCLQPCCCMTQTYLPELMYVRRFPQLSALVMVFSLNEKALSFLWPNACTRHDFVVVSV
jgi:hypothetical protein